MKTRDVSGTASGSSRPDPIIIGGIAAAVVAAAVLILVAIFGLPSVNHGNADSGLPDVPAAASPSSSAPPARPCPTGAARSGDFRLLIPRLHVDAHVETVGLDAQGEVGTPIDKFCNVGWYSKSAPPGVPGDSVLDGHLDWNGIPAIFWHLGDIRPGDEIIVARNGAALEFVVNGVQTVPYNAHPQGLFSMTGNPRLAIVTCAGDYDFKHSTYLKRLIVYAKYATETT